MLKERTTVTPLGLVESSKPVAMTGVINEVFH
jgi:hypothetical protein